MEAGAESTGAMESQDLSEQTEYTSQELEQQEQLAYDQKQQQSQAAGKESAEDRQIREENEKKLAELGEQDMEKIVTLKVNGEVMKMPLKEAVKHFQLERVSQDKMREARQAKEMAAQLIQLAKNDPDKFFDVTGIDADTFAESRLARKYELMMMSPEQRELFELKQWKEQQEQMLRQAQEEEERQALTQAEAQEMQSLEKEIVEAWQESGLPKHKVFGQFMAAQMLSHQKRTGEALQAKEAAAIVKRDFLRNVGEILTSLDAPAILDVIPKDVLSKVRQYDVERVTGKAASKIGGGRPGNNPVTKSSNKNAKPMSDLEWRDYVRNLASQTSD